MSLLKIISDLDSNIYIDEEFVCKAIANTYCKIPLQKGIYSLKIVLERNTNVFIQEDYVMLDHEMQDLKRIDLKTLLDKYVIENQKLSKSVNVGVIESNNEKLNGHDLISNIIIEEIVPICNQGKWGIIDSKGKEIIHPSYKHIEKNNDNTFSALLEIPRDIFHGLFIEKTIESILIQLVNGNLLKKISYLTDGSLYEIDIPIKYDWAKYIGQGYTAVQLNQKWGIINFNKEEIIELVYDDIDFIAVLSYKNESDLELGNYEGRIAVKTEDKWGIIDLYGVIICDFLYDNIVSLHNGYFAINNGGNLQGYEDDFGGGDKWLGGGKTGVINVFGELVFPLKYNYMSLYIDNGERYKVGFRSCLGQQRYGVITTDGKLVVKNKEEEAFIPAKYLWGYDFIDGIARVENDTELNSGWDFGFVNLKGQEVILCIYDHAEDFYNGYSFVSSRGQNRLIDVSGKVVDFAGYYSYGIIFYYKGLVGLFKDENGMCGILNINREEVSEFQYGYIEVFQNDLFKVHINDFKGLINIHGKEVQSVVYHDIFPSGIVSLFKIKIDNTFGLIDERRIEILPSKYHYISDFEDGYASVKLGNKWGYINSNGEEVGSIKYTTVFKEGFNTTGNLALVKIEDKYGLLNKDGKEIISCEYDSITYFLFREIYELKKGVGTFEVDSEGNFI